MALLLHYYLAKVADDVSEALISVKEHFGTQFVQPAERPLGPQLCRSIDIIECPVLVKADLWVQFLGMRITNDR